MVSHPPAIMRPMSSHVFELRALVWEQLRAHHGLITRAQALALGATPGWIQRRLTSGEWVVVYPGVYRVVSAPRSDYQRLLAGVWAAGHEARGSHRSATWAWGLTGSGLAVVEATVPGSRAVKLPGLIVHRSVDLPASACSERRGIPVTDPFRTLIDLGSVAPRREVADAVDVAIARRLVTHAGLLEALNRISRKGVRGGGVLRRVLDERGVHASKYPPSVLESKTARALRAGGVRAPTPELVVGENGEYRLDFPWPEAMFVLEVHGWAFHATPESFTYDIDRGNDLMDLGWLRLVKTWRHVVHHPEKMVAQVRRHLFLRRNHSPLAS